MVVVVGLFDVLVAALAPYVDYVWTGPVSLSVGAALMATATFFGFYIAAEPSLLVQTRMRESITAAVLVTYLAVVGWVAFFAPRLAHDGKTLLPLPPLTSKMVDSFTTVVAVVVGFYFAVEGTGKIANAIANRPAK